MSCWKSGCENSVGNDKSWDSGAGLLNSFTSSLFRLHHQVAPCQRNKMTGNYSKQALYKLSQKNFHWQKGGLLGFDECTDRYREDFSKISAKSTPSLLSTDTLLASNIHVAGLSPSLILLTPGIACTTQVEILNEETQREREKRSSLNQHMGGFCIVVYVCTPIWVHSSQLWIESSA